MGLSRRSVAKAASRSAPGRRQNSMSERLIASTVQVSFGSMSQIVSSEAWRHVTTFSRQTGPVEELTDQERATRLKALNALLDLMRPSVQADGGDLVLIRADVETGVVEVQLQGACSSCAISSDTLQGGVTRILKDRLAWVTDVIGGVDDSLSGSGRPQGL